MRVQYIVHVWFSEIAKVLKSENTTDFERKLGSNEINSGIKIARNNFTNVINICYFSVYI